MFRLTPMVKNILLINLGVFVALEFIVPQLKERVSLYNPFFSEHFQVYQLLTHMFVHSNFSHIFSNMLSLLIFGPMLEYVWGAKRFLIFYLICGFGASLLFLGVQTYQFNEKYQIVQRYKQAPDGKEFAAVIEHSFAQFKDIPLSDGESIGNFALQFHGDPNNPILIASSKRILDEIFSFLANIPIVGASGAVFGILMAFGMLFPNTELFLIFFPIPIKAKYFVALYGLMELYRGFQNNPADPVAHFAHLGGMLFAFFLVKYWQRHRNTFY